MVMVYEKKATAYAKSDEKQVDAFLERLEKTKLSGYAENLPEYAAELELRFAECDGLGMKLSDTHKLGIFRRGLSERLRLEAAAIQAEARNTMAPLSVTALAEELESVQFDIEVRRKRSVLLEKQRKPKRKLEADDDFVPEPEAKEKVLALEPEDKSLAPEIEPETTSNKPPPSKKKRTSKKDANQERKPSRVNFKKAAQAERPVAKVEPVADSKQQSLYFLRPLIMANIAFPILVNFACSVQNDAPPAIDTAALAKVELMTKVIHYTMLMYARSRSDHYLLDPLRKTEEVIDVINIDAELLSEPTQVTQAADFNQAIENVTKMSLVWRKSVKLAVHKRFVESWALDIIQSAAKLKQGDQPKKHQLTTMKNAAKQLLPLLRPITFQGLSESNVRRTQYLWTLLAAFRINGLSFVVAYRPDTVDTLLLLDNASRILANDIAAWTPIIKRIEQHVTGWFDVVEGGSNLQRPELRSLKKQIRHPCHFCAPWTQREWNVHFQDPKEGFGLLAPVSANTLATYGYDGFTSRRKGWAVMAAPGTQIPIAIADIPEACFLGVVPGIIRCTPFMKPGSIRGPSRSWLDTAGQDGPLAHIPLGSAEEANTVLVRHIMADPIVRLYKVPWLLAFTCRPIGTLRRLVRWDNALPMVRTENQ